MSQDFTVEVVIRKIMYAPDDPNIVELHCTTKSEPVEQIDMSEENRKRMQLVVPNSFPKDMKEFLANYMGMFADMGSRGRAPTPPRIDHLISMPFEQGQNYFIGETITIMLTKPVEGVPTQ